jgi:hypothetical protein
MGAPYRLNISPNAVWAKKASLLLPAVDIM